MKRTTKALATITLCALFAAPVLAANHAGPGRGPGYGMGQHMARGTMMGMMGQNALIPAEKQAAFNALLEAHQAEMAPLRDTMWAKHTELRALAANPNTKPETIQSLIQELTDLRTQMRAKQDAFRTKVKSELGVTLPYGMGGHGMMGGWGMGGHGMMGGWGMHGHGMMGGWDMMDSGPAN